MMQTDTAIRNGDSISWRSYRSRRPLTFATLSAHRLAMLEDLNLGYGQVQTLVEKFLETGGTHRSKLVARFKLLKRLKFPPGVNIKTGHFRYDRDATMRCMLAFTLMNSFVLPPQAVTLLNENWDAIATEIDRSLLGLATSAGDIDLTRRPTDARYIVISTGALMAWKEQEETPKVGKSGRLERPGTLMLLTSADYDALRSDPTASGAVTGWMVIDLWRVVAWTAKGIEGRIWEERTGE